MNFTRNLTGILHGMVEFQQHVLVFQACPTISAIIITFAESLSADAVDRMEGRREQLAGGSRRDRLLRESEQLERGGRLRPRAVRRRPTDGRLVVRVAGHGHVAVEGVGAAGAQGRHREGRGALQTRNRSRGLTGVP